MKGLIEKGHNKKNFEKSKALTEKYIFLRHALLKSIREFFFTNDYIEVETPNLIFTCAPDPYIDPLKVYIKDKGPFYLHTSPEMGMKKLLQFNYKRIFQICKVYRVEDIDTTHSIEFTMLEWYREGTYMELIEEVIMLLRFISKKLDLYKERLIEGEIKIYDLERLFIEKTGINPFTLKRSEFIKQSKKMVSIDKNDTWNDIFFKLYLQEVEPTIIDDRPYFVIDWPSSISSMAKPKEKNKVERFELYIKGLEIANGYTELMDSKELKKRFKQDNITRKKLKKELFLYDGEFFKAIDELSGDYAGVSIGIDRLLMALTGEKSLEHLLPFRLKV